MNDTVTQTMSVTVKDTTTGVWLVQLYKPLRVPVFW